MKKKKIAIFQANLNVGGIQRSLVNLLNSCILDNYEIDVYLFSKEIFYDICTWKKNVHLHFLKPFPYWFRFLPFGVIKILPLYRKISDEYDFVFDFDSYRQECAYCTTKMKNAKKILWIHNDIEQELRFNKKFRILYFFFRGKYRYYDSFTAVSEGVVVPFIKYSRQKNAKVTVIPNVINCNEIQKKSQEKTELVVDTKKCNVVCMGRIYIQKGYDLLLRDIYAVCQKREDLCCYIIGDGPDAEYYKKWVEDHGLSEKVFFLGNRKNPFPILKQMDAFCLESRFEGQGMVLWEAKCLGLQLIFPKRLEKYNISLRGVENVTEALINLKKREKNQDFLEEYHEYIKKQYQVLLCEK